MPFTWDEGLRRYRDTATGRLVPAAAIRSAVDVVVAGTGDYLRDLTSQLRDGSLSLSAWQQAMQTEIKSLHLATAAASRGGMAQMTPSDLGWAGQRLRGQYAYLRQFAVDIASGKQPLNGTLEARAALYAEAARSTGREMERRMGTVSGDGSEINRLGPADHCPGCLDATSRGWVAIGSLPPVGGRDCRARCRCHIQTRAQSAPGAVTPAALEPVVVAPPSTATVANSGNPFQLATEPGPGRVQLTPTQVADHLDRLMMHSEANVGRIAELESRIDSSKMGRGDLTGILVRPAWAQGWTDDALLRFAQFHGLNANDPLWGEMARDLAKESQFRGVGQRKVSVAEMRRDLADIRALQDQVMAAGDRIIGAGPATRFYREPVQTVGEALPF